MQAFLIELGSNHHYLVYAIVLVLACVEGPILSMVFGVLIKLNYFDFIPVYIVLMLGDLLGDTLWYWVGRRWGHSFIKTFGRYVNVNEENVGKITKIFNKYKNSILLISKLTTGFGFAIAVLITAGIAKIPFLKFISVNAIGQFVWSGMLIGVGYYFSQFYLQVNDILSRVSIVAVFIAFIVVAIGLRNYFKHRIDGMNI